MTEVVEGCKGSKGLSRKPEGLVLAWLTRWGWRDRGCRFEVKVKDQSLEA